MTPGKTGLVPPGSILRLGVCAGALTGAGELGYLALRKYVRHTFLFCGTDVLWMKPVAEAGVFVAFGLLLVGIGRIRRRETPLSWVVGIYGFLGSLSLLLMYPPLHRSAALVLAAGVGVQLGRLLRARGGSLAGIARHAWAPLIAVPLLVAGTLQARRLMAERDALARLPAPVTGAPNVLLIVLDTVRSSNLSLFGYPRPTTPGLERWAKGGVRFDRAFATSSWTLPSHGSLFTGRLPHELSAAWDAALDDKYPTLAEVLASKGYATAGFVANAIYCTEESGLGRGFARFDVFPLTFAQVARSSVLVDKLLGNPLQLARKDAGRVNRELLGWLDGRGRRPFFAFLNYFDAHTAYRPPEPYASRFLPPGTRGMPDPEVRLEKRRPWTMQELQPAVDSYDGAIAYLDAEVSALLAELDRRGILSKTLVVLTSDHGEQFGEHGLIYHGNSLYRPSVEVPLVVALPDVVPAGRVVTTPVSLRDIPATIVDLAAAGSSSPFPGRSLARLWKPVPGDAGAANPVFGELDRSPKLPRWYPAGRGPMRSVVADGLHYILGGDGREELYDLERDPMEAQDLAARPEHAAALGRLRLAARELR